MSQNRHFGVGVNYWEINIIIYQGRNEQNFLSKNSPGFRNFQLL